MTTDKTPSFLYLDEESGIYFYLGYPLKLTGTERAIIEVLIKSESEYVSAAMLEGEISSSRGSIGVHISSINAKAVEIGGRNLIFSKRNLGYKLSP